LRGTAYERVSPDAADFTRGYTDWRAGMAGTAGGSNAATHRQHQNENPT